MSKRSISRVVVVLTVTLAAIVAGCATERSLDPQPLRSVVYGGCTWYIERSNPIEYRSAIYTFDSDSLKLLDSLVLDHYASHMASSPDGRTLFVQVHETDPYGSFLQAFDAQTGSMKWTFQGGAFGRAIAVINSGDQILLQADIGTAVLLDATSGTAIRTIGDSLRFYGGEYEGSEALVSVEQDSLRVLCAFDVLTSTLRGEYRPRLKNGDQLGVSSAVLHPDGRRVVSMGCRCNERYDTWIVVGDLLTDSTLFEVNILHREGEVAISTDGNWAAVTDPSDAWHESAVNLSIIDLKAMKLAKRFVEPEVLYPGQVRFSEDGRTLAICPRAGNNGPLSLIDLATLEITFSIWSPQGATAYDSGVPWWGPFDTAWLPPR